MMHPPTLFLTSDHAGFELKEALKLISFPFKLIDLGPSDIQKVDYPDYILPLVSKLKDVKEARGLLICGSGIGMAIGANRHKGIRAMVGHGQSLGKDEVRLGRCHNDVNVLCLAGRLTTLEQAVELIHIFMTQPFEGGRHEIRIRKLDTL